MKAKDDQDGPAKTFVFVVALSEKNRFEWLPKVQV